MEKYLPAIWLVTKSYSESYYSSDEEVITYFTTEGDAREFIAHEMSKKGGFYQYEMLEGGSGDD